MEADRTRDVLTSNTNQVGDRATLPPPPPPPMMQAPVDYAAAAPVVPVPVAPVATDMRVDEVVSTRRVSVPAILAGILGVGMIVWGAIVLARAGLDGPFQDPVVTVAGLDANALAGAIVAGLGLLLLIAALTAGRAAILFASIVTGIAALVGVFQPDVGHGALDIERELPVVIAIGAAVVILAVALVPTMQRRVHHIDRTID
jgi:hypothetical protein